MAPPGLLDLKLTGPVETLVLASLLAALTGLTALELEKTRVLKDTLVFPGTMSTLR